MSSMLVTMETPTQASFVKKRKEKDNKNYKWSVCGDKNILTVFSAEECIPGMMLNWIWWEGLSSRVLGSAELLLSYSYF